MSLVPTLYRSSDSGAPALTGQAGSLRDLLRAVLVTGYGSGGSARAAAGWTETFTGTNKAVFRNNPVTGTGGSLRVDDSSTVSGSNARYALLRAYEAMTDVDTGTGPAPTAAQVTNGILTPKSTTADATSRAWVAIANERWCYLFVDLGNTSSGWVGVASLPLFFGDIDTRRAVDHYQFMLLGTDLTSYSGGGNLSGGMFTSTPAATTPSGKLYLLRNYLQASGAKSAGICALSDGSASGAIGNGGTYPDPVSGGLAIQRIMVAESARVIRGYMPGVYGTINGQPFTDMSVRTDIEGIPPGTTILAKTFSHALVTPLTYPNHAGQLLFDLTNEG